MAKRSRRARSGGDQGSKPPEQRKKGRPTRGRKQRAAQARARARRRRLLTRLYWAGAGLLLVGVVGAMVLAGNDAGSAESEAFDLPAMGPTAAQQERVRLADLRGKPTVVNFFASWCTACDFELPFFQRISTEFEDEVNWVGVASQETGDPMFMPNRHDVTFWTLARDINFNGLSGSLGSPRGMPLTAFYDADGTLVDVVRGVVPGEEALRGRLAALFGVGAG